MIWLTLYGRRGQESSSLTAGGSVGMIQGVWREGRHTLRRMSSCTNNPTRPRSGDYYDISGRVLFVAGTLVLIETKSERYCQGNAHLGQVATFRTDDLITGDEVDMRRMVPETTVLADLKRESLANKALDGRDPEDLRNLID